MNSQIWPNFFDYVRPDLIIVTIEQLIIVLCREDVINVFFAYIFDISRQSWIVFRGCKGH